MISMDDKCRSMGKVGVPGHVVEIDECKIGRREYHRGRIVEGNWILGMIDRNTKQVYRAGFTPETREMPIPYTV